MVYLSLFNGCGGLPLALDRAGLSVSKRYVSEVDKYAMAVNDYHYPDTVNLGDITKINGADLGHVDLVAGGSPCQGFSFAGKQLNFEDPRSVLFFDYVRLLNEVRATNPNVRFLLENVNMKKEFQDVISSYLGVEPIKINSALVSAQNRVRLYWTNIPYLGAPEDKGIVLKDIVEDGCNRIVAQRGRHLVGGVRKDLKEGTAGLTTQRMEFRKDEKSNCLTTVQKDNYVCNIEPEASDSSGEWRPASIVGRRINEDGHREDYNKSVPITQCLQVKHNPEKSGCLTTVSKDNVLSQLPPGRYADAYGKNPGGKPQKLGNVNSSGRGQNGNVYSTLGKSPTITTNKGEGAKICHQVGTADNIKGQDSIKRVYAGTGKSPCLTTMQGGHQEPKMSIDELHYRKLTPRECERLQTMPDDYTLVPWGSRTMSNSQRYKMCGNGWTIDVIAHLLSGLYL